MSPILGIYASSMQPALNASSYESIATVTVGAGGSSSISFSSIPSTYKHLQLRIIANNSNGTAIQFVYNSDTGNNYAVHSVYRTLDGSIGSNASTSRANNLTFFAIGMPSAASVFGANIVDILDYSNTSKYKTLRSLVGYDDNSVGGLALESGLWQNTNAITSITLSPQTGNFAQYSSFALYGIKA